MSDTGRVSSVLIDGWGGPTGSRAVVLGDMLAMDVAGFTDDGMRDLADELRGLDAEQVAIVGRVLRRSIELTSLALAATPERRRSIRGEAKVLKSTLLNLGEEKAATISERIAVFVQRVFSAALDAGLARIGL